MLVLEIMLGIYLSSFSCRCFHSCRCRLEQSNIRRGRLLRRFQNQQLVLYTILPCNVHIHLFEQTFRL